jgi:hypothetical protein
LYGHVAEMAGAKDTERGSSLIGALSPDRDAHVRRVVEQARAELLERLRQRAELMKRIGTLKQTIAGLAKLFGNDLVSQDLLNLVKEQKDQNRQTGLTRACRMILIEAARPMSAHEVCARIGETKPSLIAHHQDPLASVTTILNRLARYGEAESVMASGRRAWRWVAEVSP